MSSILKNSIFAVTTIVFSIWFWLICQSINSFVTIDEASRKTYDYIIVGSGTAGSVLVNRLSANPNITVLVVEAGSFFGLLSKVPLLAPFQQRTDCDWQSETTEQKFSSDGFIGRKQFIPRGKGLGGSSQLNYMLHFSPTISDAKQWQRQGFNLSNGNSSFNQYELDVETAKANDYSAKENECASEHYENQLNDESMLSINQLPYDYSLLTMSFMDAANELRVNDSQLQAYLAQYYTVRGVRHSVVDVYLKPTFRRKNVNILIKSRVLKLLFKGQQVKSISLAPENNLRNISVIHVRKEVILCAGSLNTPHLLMHSGIGPQDQLKTMGIPVIHHSPKIGRNLYDHLNVPLFVTFNETVSITRNRILSLKEIWSYLVYGNGIYSNIGVLGYVRSVKQSHSVGLFSVGSIDENAFRDIANYNQETFHANFPFYFNGSQEGSVLLTSCDQPKSRGRLSLNSKHEKDPLRVDPNYLTNSDDITCTIRAIRLGVQLMSNKYFQQLNATIIWPSFKNCKNLGPFPEDFETNHPSDKYLECIIRTSGTTGHHVGGTCSIGKNVNSPLNDRFQVRGVNGVRVVDASVLPTPVSGSPQATLITVAEQASRIIIKDQQ